MAIPLRKPRPLGTMIAYGFAGLPVSVDLALAKAMGASVLEVLPDWENLPDPSSLRSQVVDAGLQLRSAHGSWGHRSIGGIRVDLGSPVEPDRLASVDNLRRCLDWLNQAGGSFLVVHPGGLSKPEQEPARREALVRSLVALAEQASGGNLVVCVENMPRGVWPGTFMTDLASILDEIDRPELALCLDTGHAQLASIPAAETLAAGPRLRAVHVHDNDGSADLHLPPGSGLIDWTAWRNALDAIDYEGPILLECIRRIRHDPTSISVSLLTLLAILTDHPKVIAARDALDA